MKPFLAGLLAILLTLSAMDDSQAATFRFSFDATGTALTTYDPCTVVQDDSDDIYENAIRALHPMGHLLGQSFSVTLQVDAIPASPDDYDVELGEMIGTVRCVSGMLCQNDPHLLTADRSFLLSTVPWIALWDSGFRSLNYSDRSIYLRYGADGTGTLSFVMDISDCAYGMFDGATYYFQAPGPGSPSPMSSALSCTPPCPPRLSCWPQA